MNEKEQIQTFKDSLQKMADEFVLAVGQNLTPTLQDMAESLVAKYSQNLVTNQLTGWLVRGEKTHLYVDSITKPNFVLINGQDKVVSIEPHFSINHDIERAIVPEQLERNERVPSTLDTIHNGEPAQELLKEARHWFDMIKEDASRPANKINQDMCGAIAERAIQKIDTFLKE